MRSTENLRLEIYSNEYFSKPENWSSEDIASTPGNTSCSSHSQKQLLFYMAVNTVSTPAQELSPHAPTPTTLSERIL